MAIDIRIDPFPSELALRQLWRRTWNSEGYDSFSAILERSLVHLGAYDGDTLIGFVNIAWDGGIHAFLLDPCVDPAYRRQGLATRLVGEAAGQARARGAKWLHVDFEPHLETFYRSCGFRPSLAGLLDLEATTLPLECDRSNRHTGR